MQLRYHSITWGGVVGHPVGITRVRDLYYRTKALCSGPLGTLRRLAMEAISWTTKTVLMSYTNFSAARR
jgi:hypothetical protein